MPQEFTAKILVEGAEACASCRHVLNSAARAFQEAQRDISLDEPTPSPLTEICSLTVLTPAFFREKGKHIPNIIVNVSSSTFLGTYAQEGRSCLTCRSFLGTVPSQGPEATIGSLVDLR
jgi:hypothetical protein